MHSLPIKVFRSKPASIKSAVRLAIIRELIDSNIIEAVTRLIVLVSAVVAVLKGIRDVRICIDIQLATNCKFYLPVIEDLLPQFRKAKCFSSIDYSSKCLNNRALLQDS